MGVCWSPWRRRSSSRPSRGSCQFCSFFVLTFIVHVDQNVSRCKVWHFPRISLCWRVVLSWLCAKNSDFLLKCSPYSNFRMFSFMWFCLKISPSKNFRSAFVNKEFGDLLKDATPKTSYSSGSVLTKVVFWFNLFSFLSLVSSSCTDGISSS